MNKLIALTGHAQHGKDTVAAYLVAQYDFKRVGFADPLKDLAYEMDPAIPGVGRLQSLVQANGWENAKLYPEVRRILQVLGTSARDILGTDVWVNAADLRVQGTPAPVVISDCRFPNEAEYVHRQGGELWRVIRTNEDGTYYDNGIGTDHPSEALVDTLEATRVIHAASVEELEGKVFDLMGVPLWASAD